MLEKSEKDNEEILINENNIEQMETDKNEDNPKTKEKIIYILKGISCILSSIIHTFGYYSIWAVGFSGIYLLSFRRHYNTSLDYRYIYCFIPLVKFALDLTSPFGGVINDKIGEKNTIVLSSSIICFSFLLLYFSRSIYIDYIIMCFIGFGIAVGINITKKNACSYFMNRKALIISIINLIPSILSSILILYNEVFILNYNSYPSIDKLYYEEKIFMNYQKLIIFEIEILAITCLLTFLLYFKNDPKETKKFGFNEKINNDQNENNEVEKIEKNKKKITKYLKIKKAIYDKRTIRLISIVFLFFSSINLINNNLRIDKHFFFIFGVANCIVGCISSIIFGIIGDLVQFRILFVILSALLSATLYILVKYFEGEFTSFIMAILIPFIYHGFNIIFDSHIMKVYGLENYIEIWGIIKASIGIWEIFGIILNFSLQEESYVYKIIYAITGCFSLISFGLGLFEKDDKFDYDK